MRLELFNALFSTSKFLFLFCRGGGRICFTRFAFLNSSRQSLNLNNGVSRWYLGIASGVAINLQTGWPNPGRNWQLTSRTNNWKWLIFVTSNKMPQTLSWRSVLAPALISFFANLNRIGPNLAAMMSAVVFLYTSSAISDSYSITFTCLLMQ